MADRLQSGDGDLTSTTRRCNCIIAWSLRSHSRWPTIGAYLSTPHDLRQSTLPNREVTAASARGLTVLKTVAPRGCGPQDCGSSRLWSSRLWLLTAVVIVAAERVCTT